MSDRPAAGSAPRAAGGRWAKKPGTAPTSTASGSSSGVASRTGGSSSAAGRPTRAPIVIGKKHEDAAPEAEAASSSSGGLWSKMKAMTVGADEAADGGEAANPDDSEPPSSQSSGLWNKLKNVTTAIKDRLEEVDSDDTDHEGTTHVVHVLTDYYKQKDPNGELPGWLTRSGTPPNSNRKRQEHQRQQQQYAASGAGEPKMPKASAFKPMNRGGADAFKPMGRRAGP